MNLKQIRALIQAKFPAPTWHESVSQCAEKLEMEPSTLQARLYGDSGLELAKVLQLAEILEHNVADFVVLLNAAIKAAFIAGKESNGTRPQ